MTPIVNNPQLSGSKNFKRYFDTVARWKTRQKRFSNRLLRVWYNDDNAVIRQKVTAMGLKRITRCSRRSFSKAFEKACFLACLPRSSVRCDLLNDDGHVGHTG